MFGLAQGLYQFKTLLLFGTGFGVSLGQVYWVTLVGPGHFGTGFVSLWDGHLRTSSQFDTQHPCIIITLNIASLTLTYVEMTDTYLH